MQDVTLGAAAADAEVAVREYGGARRWLARAAHRPTPPLAAEVWVYDRALRQVLLVEHRWRGWVPPGGTVEVGETPRQAAARELFEETGLRADLLPSPAAVTVRSYRPGWSATLGLSYAAVVEDTAAPLVPEHGQPAAWTPLERAWQSCFASDHLRISWHAGWLARTGPVPGPTA